MKCKLVEHPIALHRVFILGLGTRAVVQRAPADDFAGPDAADLNPETNRVGSDMQVRTVGPCVAFVCTEPHIAEAFVRGTGVPSPLV